MNLFLISPMQLMQTPLHIAASHNRVDMMKYLLDWAGPVKVELEAKNVVCDKKSKGFLLFRFGFPEKWLLIFLHFIDSCSMVSLLCTRQLRMDATTRL